MNPLYQIIYNFRNCSVNCLKKNLQHRLLCLIIRALFHLRFEALLLRFCSNRDTLHVLEDISLFRLLYNSSINKVHKFIVNLFCKTALS